MVIPPRSGSIRGSAIAVWWAACALPSHAFTGHRAPTGLGALPRGGPAPLRAISMWQAFGNEEPSRQSSVETFRTIFGARGERGEYMDGYSAGAMETRCIDDYGWADGIFSHSSDMYATERSKMMCHLYDNGNLWEHVCMVAFAEHYVVADGEEKEGSIDANEIVTAKPFGTFQRQRELQPPDRPIFGGVVLDDWEEVRDDTYSLGDKLSTFRQRDIDYVRLECNFGAVGDIGDASQLADNPILNGRFRRLAEAARACQAQEMVPLVLIQVPWRETEVQSREYYARAIQCFADASRDAGVDSKRLLLETRPPIGMSAREEKGLDEAARISLGLETGRKMFDTIEGAFGGDTIAGFCVAGGSTKGENPTAMEDDVQNAVRQGIRQSAMRQWGYEICFWEMGAKLMLQPRVGQLWGDGHEAGHDMARYIFCANAKALSEEIIDGINR